MKIFRAWMLLPFLSLSFVANSSCLELFRAKSKSQLRDSQGEGLLMIPIVGGVVYSYLEFIQPAQRRKITYLIERAQELAGVREVPNFRVVHKDLIEIPHDTSVRNRKLLEAENAYIISYNNHQVHKYEQFQDEQAKKYLLFRDVARKLQLEEEELADKIVVLDSQDAFCNGVVSRDEDDEDLDDLMAKLPEVINYLD